MPALPKSMSLCSRLNGFFLCLLGFFLVLMSSWLPLVAQMASRRAPPHIWLSKIVNGVVFVLQMHQIRATPQMEPEGDSAASDAPWCSGTVHGLSCRIHLPVPFPFFIVVDGMGFIVFFVTQP